MVLEKLIVILMKAQNEAGLCIAGKEIIGTKIGGWILPFKDNSSEGGNFQFKDGEPPELLDIVKIRLGNQIIDPNQPYQTEIYELVGKTCLEKVGTYQKKNLEMLLDNVEALWINGYNSFNGTNNRIPHSIVMSIRSSLLCIKPENFLISVQAELDIRNVRAKFKFRGMQYCCTIIDEQIIEEFRHEEEGDFQISRKSPYLCIKLGNLYKEYCYKVVAGVIL